MQPQSYVVAGLAVLMLVTASCGASSHRGGLVTTKDLRPRQGRRLNVQLRGTTLIGESRPSRTGSPTSIDTGRAHAHPISCSLVTEESPASPTGSSDRSERNSRGHSASALPPDLPPCASSLGIASARTRPDHRRYRLDCRVMVAMLHVIVNISNRLQDRDRGLHSVTLHG